MGNWRNTSKYRLWRILCKRRDGWKCTVTGLTEDLEVHHINSGSFFPNERYDIDNGITLNKNVHAEFHIAFMKGYRKKCTKKDWNKFLWCEKYKIQRFKAMAINMINQL
jgi:hypothetical protein